MVCLYLWFSSSNFLTHFFWMITLTSCNNMGRSIDLLNWFILLRLGFNTFILVLNFWLRGYIVLCIRLRNAWKLFFQDLFFGKLILVFCDWKLIISIDLLVLLNLERYWFLWLFRWFFTLIVNTCQIESIMSLLLMACLPAMILLLLYLIEVRICLIIEHLNIVLYLEMLVF